MVDIIKVETRCPVFSGNICFGGERHSLNVIHTVHGNLTVVESHDFYQRYWISVDWLIIKEDKALDVNPSNVKFKVLWLSNMGYFGFILDLTSFEALRVKNCLFRHLDLKKENGIKKLTISDAKDLTFLLLHRRGPLEQIDIKNAPSLNTADLTEDIIVAKEISLINIKVNSISLNATSIAGDLIIKNNAHLTEIHFPALETVGRISIEGNLNLKKVSLPRLVKAKSLRISDHLDLIEINEKATWEKESLFNADNFCWDYHYKFKGLVFRELIHCPDLCLESGMIDSENYKEFSACTKARGAFKLDGTLIEGVFNSSLGTLDGSLELYNFHKGIAFPYLQSISELLSISGDMFVDHNSFRSLEKVDELSVIEMRSSPYLTFNELQATSIKIASSSLYSVDGLDTIRLINSVLLEDNPHLRTISFKKLLQANDITVKKNPSLCPIHDALPYLSQVGGTLEIAASNYSTLHLGLQKLGLLVLNGNMMLERAEFPNLGIEKNKVTTKNNPTLESITLKPPSVLKFTPVPSKSALVQI